MKLILIRHGETVANVTGIVAANSETELTEVGREQARKLGERLKDEKIDFIYSSTLKRASDTAKEIAKYHPDVPFKLTDELRETDFGKYNGVKKEDVEWEKIDKQTWINSYKRAGDFLHKNYKKHFNKTVVFVSHMGFTKNILLNIYGKTPGDYRSLEQMHNTSITIIEFDEDKNHKIHVLNSIAHLE